LGLIGSSSQQKDPTGAWQIKFLDCAGDGLSGGGGDDDEPPEDGSVVLPVVPPLDDEEATQFTVYDVAPSILDIEHDHTENEFVQPARAVLHKFVPTPLLMKVVRSAHVQTPVGAVTAEVGGDGLAGGGGVGDGEGGGGGEMDGAHALVSKDCEYDKDAPFVQLNELPQPEDAAILLKPPIQSSLLRESSSYMLTDNLTVPSIQPHDSVSFHVGDAVSYWMEVRAHSVPPLLSEATSLMRITYASV